MHLTQRLVPRLASGLVFLALAAVACAQEAPPLVPTALPSASAATPEAKALRERIERLEKMNQDLANMLEQLQQKVQQSGGPRKEQEDEAPAKSADSKGLSKDQ